MRHRRRSASQLAPEVPYGGDAGLKDAAYLLGEEASLPLRFRPERGVVLVGRDSLSIAAPPGESRRAAFAVPSRARPKDLDGAGPCTGRGGFGGGRRYPGRECQRRGCGVSSTK